MYKNIYYVIYKSNKILTITYLTFLVLIVYLSIQYLSLILPINMLPQSLEKCCMMSNAGGIFGYFSVVLLVFLHFFFYIE